MITTKKLGLYGYDNIGFEFFPRFQIQYWEGIVEALQSLGATVIVARVSKTGSVALRAQQLHELLERTVSGQEVNLIGHSMGGLDGRYLISRIANKSYQVSSLTTIGTPHRGSPFMDWCRDNLKVGRMMMMGSDYKPPENGGWLERIMQTLDAPAYSHLTTDYCTNLFNPSTPDDPKVKYYSYTAFVERMPTTHPLYLPWRIINSRVGRNDGVVPLESGHWGQLVETVQASHFDLVARYRWLVALAKAITPTLNPYSSSPSPSYFKPTPKLNEKFDNIEFYLRVMSFLRSQGF